MNDSKPSALRSAIEEAFLAENGFNEMLMVEINAAAGNLEYIQSLTRGVYEASDSNQDQESNSLNKASSIYSKAFHLKILSLEFISVHQCLDKNAEDSLNCIFIEFANLFFRCSSRMLALI